MTRSRPKWSRTGALTTTPVAIYLPNDWTELKILVDARCYGCLGAAYAAPAVAGVSPVITIRSLGGTVQMRVNPQDNTGAVLSAATAYNASAATIKTNLVGTGLFASGDVTAAGGALPTDVTLTFAGVYTGITPKLDVLNASITGTGSITALVTTEGKGNGGYGYLEANVQEVWGSDESATDRDRFLYLASIGASANYFVTALR
jgi:hypothetical protein